MLAILFVVLPVAVARHDAPKHAHSVTLSTPHELGFLQKSDSCECSHHGTCSCQGALEFMTCIKNSCESGECRCVVDDRKHFKEACQNMASGCPDLGLICADAEATCDGETIGWIPNDDSIQFHAGEKHSQDSFPSVFHRKLPDGWEKTWSEEEGRYYYANRETGESSWTHPQASASDDRSMVDTAGYSQASPVAPKETQVNVNGNSLAALKRREHHNFAKGTLAGVVGLTVLVALMSSSNPDIVKNTWFTANFTICVFVALLWYYVTTAYFSSLQMQIWAKITVHMGVAILLLLLSSLLTWALQMKCGNSYAATFNSIYDHILVWVFVGIANKIQLQFQPSVIEVFLVTCGLAMFFAILAFVWYTVVEKHTTQFGAAHSIDFLAATAMASAVVDCVHLVLTGAWHKVGYHDPVKKTLTTEFAMAFCSLFWIYVALKLAPVVKRLHAECVYQNGQVKPNMYWRMRAVDTLGIFAPWLSHFSCVLNLGNFVIGHFGLNPTSVDGHLYTTIVSCLIGVGLIALCTKVAVLREDASLSNVLIGLSGFMIGTSVAGGINNSIEMALEGNKTPIEWRLFIASSLTAIVFPVYFFCFKPLCDQKLSAK